MQIRLIKNHKSFNGLVFNFLKIVYNAHQLKVKQILGFLEEDKFNRYRSRETKTF